MNPLYVLRVYDRFDGWLDVSGPVSKEEADRRLNEATSNGTQMTKYEDDTYFSVFPANTVMLYRPETLGR